MKRDPGLDNLLLQDGVTYVVHTDEQGDAYWVKFEVRRVDPSPEKPHGLDYSLTLHGPNSGDPNDSRLVGFDNAHAAPRSGPGGQRDEWDHKHRFRTIRPYDYADARTLVEDFWAAVDGVLKERGVP